MSQTVEYFARVTCDCGVTSEVECWANSAYDPDTLEVIGVLNHEAPKCCGVEGPAAPKANETKHALDNAERLLEQEGVQCVRRLVDGRWVIEWDNKPYTVVGSSLHEAFEALRKAP